MSEDQTFPIVFKRTDNKVAGVLVYLFATPLVALFGGLLAAGMMYFLAVEILQVSEAVGTPASVIFGISAAVYVVWAGIKDFRSKRAAQVALWEDRLEFGQGPGSQSIPYRAMTTEKYIHDNSSLNQRLLIKGDGVTIDMKSAEWPIREISNELTRLSVPDIKARIQSDLESGKSVVFREPRARALWLTIGFFLGALYGAFAIYAFTYRLIADDLFHTRALIFGALLFVCVPWARKWFKVWKHSGIELTASGVRRRGEPASRETEWSEISEISKGTTTFALIKEDGSDAARFSRACTNHPALVSVLEDRLAESRASQHHGTDQDSSRVEDVAPVRIDYECELYGSTRKVCLPFVTAVFADLSGNPEQALPPVSKRKMLEFDVDNFDDRMTAIGPRIVIQVPNKIGGDSELNILLRFESVEDFSPTAVASQIPELSSLLEERARLLNQPPGHDARAGSVPAETAAPQRSNTAGRSVAEIDRVLTQQLNQILHHPKFQALEGTWRGLRHLVDYSDTDEMLKIKVFNISKQEFGEHLISFDATDWQQNEIYRQLDRELNGQYGEPFGCLLGDYFFDHRPEDVKTLTQIGKMASAVFAPFIAGAAPSVLNLDSWHDLSEQMNVQSFFYKSEAHESWRSLRESEDSRFIALALPRVLARLPYSDNTSPENNFTFMESVDDVSQRNFTWINSAYAMGVNVNRAFKCFGWCACIRGIETGGSVDGFPRFIFSNSGEGEVNCSTETSLSEIAQHRLSKAGFLPLMDHDHLEFPVFMQDFSLYRCPDWEDREVAANDSLYSRLSYIFAVSRFAHHLKCIVRDRAGSFVDREDMESYLNSWINGYVAAESSGEKVHAGKPLARAEVKLEEDDECSDRYIAQFFVQPRYQLEGVSYPMRLVARVPAVTADYPTE